MLNCFAFEDKDEHGQCNHENKSKTVSEQTTSLFTEPGYKTSMLEEAFWLQLVQREFDEHENHKVADGCQNYHAQRSVIVHFEIV